MARRKKAQAQQQAVSDDTKIQEWLAANKVTKVAQNVGGNFEPKSFFGRRAKKKIGGKVVGPAKPSETPNKTK